MVRRPVIRGPLEVVVSAPEIRASFHPYGTDPGVFHPCGTDPGLFHPLWNGP